MCVYTDAICSKVWKFLSGLKRHLIVHRNLFKKLNQVSSTVITLSSLLEDLQDYCWFEKSPEKIQSQKKLSSKIMLED